MPDLSGRVALVSRGARRLGLALAAAREQVRLADRSLVEHLGSSEDVMAALRGAPSRPVG